MNKYVLWGVGKYASVIFETIASEIVIVVDNNAKRWGEVWNGFVIQSPDVLRNRDIVYDKIIVASLEWRIIKKQLIEELKIEQNLIDNSLFRHREQFLNFYKDAVDREIKQYVEYVRENPLGVFNDKFVEKYTEIDNEAYFDNEKQLFFVLYNYKKCILVKKLILKKRPNDIIESY